MPSNPSLAIADSFNHVHQMYASAESADVLTDVAVCIRRVLIACEMCTEEAFNNVASMSGLDLTTDSL